MNIQLHKNATATPARRAAIQASGKPVRALAQEFGVSEDTIRRWKRRETVSDGSHMAQRLQTTLSPAQDAIVLELRKVLGLALDDLLVVTREFIHEQATRSGLHRLLKRHGLSRVPQLRKEKVPAKPFKTYEPGFLYHIDVKYLPQMADETQRGYLFMVIDRATRWVFVQIKSHKRASAARSFLRALYKATPVQTMKHWYAQKSELFNRQPRNHPGPDS